MTWRDGWPFGVFVFWLISFPMNGFLVPDDGGNHLPWFVLASSLSYFLGSRLLRDGIFDLLTRIASVSTALLTLLFLYAPTLRLPLMVAMGLASPPILLRAIAHLKKSRDPILAAGIGIALGNSLVFSLSKAPIGNPAKYFILASALLLQTAFRVDIPKRPAPSGPGGLNRYLPVLFLYYLTGGLLYAAIIPRYERLAFQSDVELLFYVASSLAGIALVKRMRDHALAVGILAGALAFSFLLPEGVGWTNLAMYLLQSSFGIIDLYLVALLLDSGGAPEAVGRGYGTVCLSIALGEGLHFGVVESPLHLIAMGNVVLILAVLVLYFLGQKRGSSVPEPALEGGRLDQGAETDCGTLSAELLDSRLRSYYKEHQKQLSDKEKKVLVLILQGKTYRGAAEALGISESTVKTHMKRVYEKMGVRSKEEIRNLIFETRAPV